MGTEAKWHSKLHITSWSKREAVFNLWITRKMCEKCRCILCVWKFGEVGITVSVLWWQKDHVSVNV